MKSRLAVLIVGLLASSVVGMALDPDQDNRSNYQELQDGTLVLWADSDHDGLDDGQEWEYGTDPLEPDEDADGVADGHERALMCITADDCDQDGLPDGQDQGEYDPLDPDSFDVGLYDGVVAAYEAAGQPASRDEDQDGIPDGWESDDGLVQWSPFSPAAGNKDFLVEFIRVEGPDSGRFRLDFSDAYDEVVDMFAGDGILMQWTETIVSRDVEHRPDFLTVDEVGYYEGVLEEGQATKNPFVTTVVLNPQQTQQDLAGTILGAAFLRSMIATVDYGAHVSLEFKEDHSNGISLGGSVFLTPALESHIIDARAEQLEQLDCSFCQGIIDLGTDGRDLYIVTRSGDDEFRWQWEKNWYSTAPNITLVADPSNYLQLEREGVEVHADDLAHTIAHELGHTLGLCHAHDSKCQEGFLPSERTKAAIDSSTMSYTSSSGSLHFLRSEWEQVHEYLQCPPQSPVAYLASGSDTDEFLQAKYYDSFNEKIDLRSCTDTTPVSADLPEPRATSTSPDGSLRLFSYIAISLAITGLAGWRVGRIKG